MKAPLHGPSAWALAAWGTALQKSSWGVLVDT